MFKKKTDKKDELAGLVAALKKYPSADIQAVALDLLGKDAQEWYAHRAQTNRLLLPNNRWVSEFEANGVVYYVLKPEELSELRFTKLRQIESAVGMDSTVSSIVQSLNRMSAYYNTLVTKEPKLGELRDEIANLQAAMLKTERNWDYSLYAASLVICRKGSDKAMWDERTAGEDIDNWNKAGFPASDFFLLVMSYTSLWNDWLKRSLEVASKATVSLFGGI